MIRSPFSVWVVSSTRVNTDHLSSAGPAREGISTGPTLEGQKGGENQDQSMVQTPTRKSMCGVQQEENWGWGTQKKRNQRNRSQGTRQLKPKRDPLLRGVTEQSRSVCQNQLTCWLILFG